MLTIDVGNTSVGVGLWTGAKVVVRRFREPEQAAELVDGEAFVISVSAPRLARLQDAVAAHGRGRLRGLRGLPLPVADPTLERSAGPDRLAAAAAARPGPAVVVDAGTAVTVDLVDAEGVFRGGFIAPGLSSALDGLSRGAPALPRIQAGPVPIVPGLETRGALAAGVWGLVVGGVDRLVDAAREGLAPQTPRLVATGGWGQAWAAASRHGSIENDPDLVHRGIAQWSRISEAPTR